jgi:hypothetical protein
MIELSNEPAFLSGIRGQTTRWSCARCMRAIPDEAEYIDTDGTHHIFRAIDSVRHAEIVERVSNCRLCIIIAVAAFAGGMVIYTFDRAPLFPLTSFDSVAINIFRVAAALLVFGFGAVVLGVIADIFLTRIVRRRADREMRSRREAEQGQIESSVG